MSHRHHYSIGLSLVGSWLSLFPCFCGTVFTQLDQNHAYPIVVLYHWVEFMKWRSEKGLLLLAGKVKKQWRLFPLPPRILIHLVINLQEWSVRYSSDEPIQPRFELNAPDLYIPTMAYLTYVLVAGFALGTQDRFTPESLGIQASSALAWTILEVLFYLVCFYILNITTTLSTIDILAFSGYKFVGIIPAVLASLLFFKMGYLLVLGYFGLGLAYFLVSYFSILSLRDMLNVLSGIRAKNLLFPMGPRGVEWVVMEINNESWLDPAWIYWKEQV